jgi:hypothetical protein
MNNSVGTHKWQAALSAKYPGEAPFLSSTNHAQKWQFYALLLPRNYGKAQI